MLLNDREIAELCNKHSMISPFRKEKIHKIKNRRVVSFGLSSFGYDISLSRADFRIFVFNNETALVVDPKNPKNTFYSLRPASDGSFLIPPHSYALGVSKEHFKMPFDVLGICIGKSTYARCGIILPMTPLEPDWRGHLTVEISNSNSLPAKVYADEGIAQVIFLQGNLPDLSYSGKYQDQGPLVKTADV